MSNQKSMTVHCSILTLYERGWSKSRVARELGIHRETVARHIRNAQRLASNSGFADSKPSILPLGNGGSKPSIPPIGYFDSKPSILPAGNEHRHAGRRSQCAEWGEQIEHKLGQGLTAQRIYQDLAAEAGYTGSYDAVKRYCRKLKAKHPERVWRIECMPGEEAQVDFGSGCYLSSADGHRRKVHLLRVVLSHSRKGYTEAVERQTADNFIRCLENAFRYFGGVPQTLCIDNLRAAVIRPDWYEPELTPKVASFCRHYGTAVLPCRVRMPEHKGKVENSIKYVKSNALKARVFESIAKLNEHLMQWESNVADTRIHGTTRRQIREQFETVERPRLQKLPPGIFPCFSEGKRSVHRDSYVEVAKAYYAVPPEYIGQQVWVRWDGRIVRIFNQRFEQIAVLARQRPGQFTNPLGARGRPNGGAERDQAYWLKRCARIGDHCGLWALEIISKHGIIGVRVLQGLVNMSGKHSGHVLDQACERALSHGAYRLRDIRNLIEHPVTQKCMSFMTNHPLIRDMREYTEFLESLYPENEPMRNDSFKETALVAPAAGSLEGSPRRLPSATQQADIINIKEA
jgi:transposase